MNLSRAISVVVIGASLGLGAAVHAQSLKNVATPSEFPPTSYKSKQYVDSKGCVYIRAGVDGNVSWIPRMTRDRKVICGYKPTNPNAAPTTASAQKLDNSVVFIEPAAAPTVSAFDSVVKPKTSSSAVAATKPKPAASPKATTTVATAAAPDAAPATPKPKSSSTNFWNWGTTTSAPASAKTAATTSTPAASNTAAATTTATATTVAPTKTTSTRRTLDQTPRQSGSEATCRDGVKSKYKRRCGPQSALPYTPGTGNPTAPAPVININRSGASLSAPAVGTIVKEGEVASNVRVVPKHVYDNRRLALKETPVPNGYRRVFDDGRLNPYRAEQTFAGKAAMDAIWTQKVPRMLRHEMQDGVVVSTKSTTNALTTSPAPVVSTKSPSAEKSIRLSGQSYVQVATFQDKTAAQGVAKRIKSLGMPAKIGKYSRDGATYRIVLAGPFASPKDADRAAAQARNAGYSGAFVRN